MPSQLTGEEPEETIQKLKQYFARVDATRPPMTGEEEDEIITEALRSTRPNYRPNR